MAAEDYEGMWPVPKFHYEVEIDGTPISFQEVSGLDMETTPIEYRHGDSEEFHPNKMAGLIKYSDITLKKGVFHDDEDSLEFMKAIVEEKAYYTQDDRFDVVITLLDEQGEAVMSVNAMNCFPSKYSFTDLKSDANEVAIESMVICAESWEIEFE